MNVPLRPLGKIREIVLSTGLDISYAYDDLVFSENSVFILQFDETFQDRIRLYFNSDCNSKEAQVLEKRLLIAGQIGEFTIVNSGLFSLEQKEGKEEIEIRFHK